MSGLGLVLAERLGAFDCDLLEVGGCGLADLGAYRLESTSFLAVGFVLLTGEIPAGQSNPFGLPAKAPTRRNRPACLAIAFVEDLQEAQRSR